MTIGVKASSGMPEGRGSAASTEYLASIFSAVLAVGRALWAHMRKLYRAQKRAVKTNDTDSCIRIERSPGGIRQFRFSDRQ